MSGYTRSPKESNTTKTHGGKQGGHFPGQHAYNALATHWWWMGMYTDTCRFCKTCPQCAIVTGSGRVKKPPLYPIPVQRPFQIFGVDVTACYCLSGHFHKVAPSISSIRSKQRKLCQCLEFQKLLGLWD